MAYTKHTWTTGEVITAGRLNHMEDGIADAGNGGGLVITATTSGSTTTLDKTWQEIHDAFANGVMCVIVNGNSTTAVTSVSHPKVGYDVTTTGDTYAADTPSGYPAQSVG